jgi:aminopeptidase N
MISARNRILRYSLREKKPLIDTTVRDLMKLLNTNSYQKGAWVLHMLRSKLGDEKFWEGMRLFYEKFKGSNVLTSDFQKIMEEAGKCDLEKFFFQWCFIPGEPELKIDLISGRSQDLSELVIEQRQEYLFEFDIEIEFIWKGNRIIRSFSIDEQKEKFILRIPPDAEVKADPGIKLLYRDLNDQVL